MNLWKWVLSTNIVERVFVVLMLSILLLYVHSRVLCPRIAGYGTMKKMNELGNGDLLFLSGETSGEKTCRWASGSPFSHVSIIFLENNIPYVLECDIGGHHTDGIRIMTLEAKLQRKDQSSIVGYRRLHSQHLLKSSDFVNVYEKYTKEFEFDTSMASWLWGSSQSKRKKMFCSEFVCFALDKLGVCTFDKPHYTYSPGDLTSWRFMKMNKGMLYSPIQLITLTSM
jgi:hypothetical protein